jgi:hypothetical protein
VGVVAAVVPALIAGAVFLPRRRPEPVKVE